LIVADFVLFARTQPIGGGFRTVVAAVAFEATLRLEDPGNVAFVSSTAAEASERAGVELKRLGERLRAEGHRVVDTVVEDQGPFDEDRRLR
jgi:hypothetical protein